VGHLARRSGLTTKALRHYDRIGLLLPASSIAVLATGAIAPIRCRRPGWSSCCAPLDLPLGPVRTALPAWDSGAGAPGLRIVREHRRRLDARVTRLRDALHRIDHLIAEGIEGTMTDLDGHAGAATTRSPPGAGTVTNEKLLASQLFNEVWRLMEQDVRTTDD